MLADGVEAEGYYTVNAQILEYEGGNAFKRWLLPGFGSTVLYVYIEFVDRETETVVGKMEHRRSVGAGGLFSVGAWRTIFSYLARDVAADIRRKRSGGGDTFVVSLERWAGSDTADVPNPETPRSIWVDQLHDGRDQTFRLGERHAALNTPMGNVYSDRSVTRYLTEALRNELRAAGHKITRENGDLHISGEITRFWVWTDTSLTYWDVNSEIVLNLTVEYAETAERITRTYAAKATDRTYLWPRENFVGAVVSEAVKSLMRHVGGDRIWAN